MTLTLWHVPDWGSMIIRLALEELGQPYELNVMDWDAGDFDTPAFRAVNPLGLVPALETPDGPIFETAAILLWLNQRYGGLGPAPSDPAYAAFLSWLMFTSNTVHTTVMTLVHPDRHAGAWSAKEVYLLALDRLNEQAARLETLLTTQSPRWLTPAEPALGHYLGVLFRWTGPYVEHGPCFDLTPFPALRAMLAAHEATPAAHRVAVADDIGAHPYTDPE